MTRYLQIVSMQRPFDIGKDTSGNFMFSCNYMAVAEGPVDDWEGELARVVIDLGLGVAGSNLFIGQASIVPPAGAGPFTTIIDTGGISPDETHNGSKYEKLTAQIIVRGKDYEAARARALAIWSQLDGLRETTLTA